MSRVSVQYGNLARAASRQRCSGAAAFLSIHLARTRIWSSLRECRESLFCTRIMGSVERPCTVRNSCTEANFALQLKGWRENMENFCGSKPPEGGCGSRQAQGFYPLWQPTASVFHGNRRFADCDPIAQFDRFDPRTTIGLPLEVRAVSRALDFLIPVSEALPQRGTRDSNPQPRVPTRSQNRKRPNAQSHRANGGEYPALTVADGASMMRVPEHWAWTQAERGAAREEGVAGAPGALPGPGPGPGPGQAAAVWNASAPAAVPGEDDDSGRDERLAQVARFDLGKMSAAGPGLLESAPAREQVAAEKRPKRFSPFGFIEQLWHYTSNWTIPVAVTLREKQRARQQCSQHYVHPEKRGLELTKRNFGIDPSPFSP
ncbi:putative cytosol aminopeptidase [Frankliniella fusca]|uniref:Cytosol aminopeptidase n=1 Tax=Frankliniella fusca TaxID=407009 RepID=A0AAE1LJH2_9NEOP|nr:putative cytosol aminopeptidase [Frankliniella fusca]